MGVGGKSIPKSLILWTLLAILRRRTFVPFMVESIPKSLILWTLSGHEGAEAF